MITSKLTSKARITIPRPVRAALRLREGDALAWQIKGARVILTRARKAGAALDPFPTFGEWDSEADRKAYGGLCTALLLPPEQIAAARIVWPDVPLSAAARSRKRRGK